MFRTFLIYVLLVLGNFIFSGNLHAGDILVEAKAAYFAPMSHRFQKIYSGGGIYGGEVTFQVRRHLYGWASVDFFLKNGHSIGEHDPTEITIVPLVIGLKYLFPVSCADLYLGVGVTGTYLHMEDHSPFVIPKITKCGVGGILKAGAMFNLSKRYFADLFTSYNYTKIDFHNTDNGRVIRHSADLSGLTFGIGIGYRFGCPI